MNKFPLGMRPYSGLGTMDQIVFPIRDHLKLNETGSTILA